MALRKQRAGNQHPWTLEDLKDGLEVFFKQHGRYPRTHEVDDFEYLPSSRSIQRTHGGLVEVRKQLKLSGQNDYRSGAHSTERAKKINKRNHKVEQEIYNYLVNRFGKEFVHREHFFTDDRRTRADFFVYTQKSNFSIDSFYARDRHNLIGCLNSKLRKYDDNLMLQYPVIFLQMNENISENEMRSVVQNKKRKLHPYQHLMSFEQLKTFCKDKKPHTLK